MKATHLTYLEFNDLQRGKVYKATTPTRIVVGEYLGIETPHGDLSMLIRHTSGTESIALCAVTSLRLGAA